MKSVGIIGGLGPETTSEFYLDVVFSCQKQDKTARPSIIIASVPIPLQLEEDVITKNEHAEKILPFLIAEAKRLEKAGAHFIVMPCNSLHVFISQIRGAVSVPVLSIIEETVAFLKRNNFKKVGIVSTSATIENNLYETAFAEKNIGFEAPDSFQQAKLGKFIHNLVIGQQNSRDRDELVDIIDGLEKRDVDCVILACTDLQLLIPKHPTLAVFDTMKILADATVKEMLTI